jgi:hypothetical protein
MEAIPLCWLQNKLHLFRRTPESLYKLELRFYMYATCFDLNLLGYDVVPIHK